MPAFLAALSVGVLVADGGLRVVAAPAVGVQPAPEAAGLTAVAALVGVSPPTPDVFAGITQVSVSLEPLVSSISPAAAARGTTNLTLTMTGSGLGGATAIDFLLNNAADGAITATNLTATPDGTQATVQISITSGATTGPRVVRIHAPAGTTTSVGAGGNVFTVQ